MTRFVQGAVVALALAAICVHAQEKDSSLEAFEGQKTCAFTARLPESVRCTLVNCVCLLACRREEKCIQVGSRTCAEPPSPLPLTFCH